MSTTQQSAPWDFYLPEPDPTARPEDVVRVVAYYAEQAAVDPRNRDYARAGYWAAIGRASDAGVMRGGRPVGHEDASGDWSVRPPRVRGGNESGDE